MPVTILRTRDGVLDQADETALAELGRRLAQGTGKLLLHLHGGLVSQKVAEDAADRLSREEEKSFKAPREWEQVYVIWRTGLFETIQTNWYELAKDDRIYRAILKRVLKVVSEKIGVDPLGAARGAGTLTLATINDAINGKTDTPLASFDAGADIVRSASRGIDFGQTDQDIRDDLKRELEGDADLDSAADDIAAQMEADTGASARGIAVGQAGEGAKLLERLDRNRVQEFETESPPGTSRAIFGPNILAMLVGHGVAIGLAVIKRYRSGHDHGLYATVVEELVRRLYGDRIGSAIWGMMKNDAADHFRAGRMGEEFLSILEATKPDRIVVSAHSAGSIWASEMLLSAASRGLQTRFDCAYLAPAVRTTKFAEALESAGHLIGKFRMYAMSDELERADVLLGKNMGFIYPSSLLYCVSGLFEDARHVGLPDAPLLGMQRFVGTSSPWDTDVVEGPVLATIRNFLGQHDRQVFAISDIGGGMNTAALSHGGFDDEPETLASVATFFG